MRRVMTDWSGEFGELLGWEDELLANPEVCERLFASKHEALEAGCFIGERSKRGNAHTVRASGNRSAGSQGCLVWFEYYSNETFEQFIARLHKFLDEIYLHEMSERENDRLRYLAVPAPVDDEGEGP
jgi:hypothetical protein